MNRIACLSLALAALTACNGPVTDIAIGGAETEPSFVDTGMDGMMGPDWAEFLHLRTGCSDTTLHLWNESQEIGLTVVVPGLLERASAAGERYTETIELETGDAQAFIEHASPISDNYCNDALSEREVFETWTADTGAVVLSLDPPQDPDGAVRVKFDLWNTSFLDSDGRELFESHLDAGEIEVLQAWGG